MLIAALVNYANREKLVEDPLFEKRPVRWQLSVGPGGLFHGLVQLGDPKRGLELAVPKKVGSNAGGVASFGTDNARFVLGLTDNPGDAAKADRDMAAFVALLGAAAESDPANQAFAAARNFYATPGQVLAARGEAVEKKVKDADRVALAIATDNGLNLFETEGGRAFWRTYRSEQDANREQAEAAECLACGQLLPPVNTADTKLMGLPPDGQPSGRALVSFDKNAFQSHGWAQNANAAICEPCSQAYTRGLNGLLRRDNSPRTRVDLAGNAFVVWCEAGPVPLLDALDLPDEVRAVLAQQLGSGTDPTEGARTLLAASTGRAPGDGPPDSSRVFALGLKGNGGRAVVVEWFDLTVAQAWANLRAWFADLQVRLIFDETGRDRDGKRVIYTESGQLSRPVPLRLLARATARDFDYIGKRVPAALLRAALHGDALPQTIFARCIERLSLDGFGDYLAPARVGLIRCYLNRSPLRKGAEIMPGLDPAQTDPAYLCGRLMATLEAVQYQGVGDVGADIVDRFYRRASTAPALVFGQLMSLAQNHLGAINNPGTRTNLERELQEIVGGLDAEFPRTLTLQDQGRFAIGYWHQRAHRFAEIRRRRDERAASGATDTGTDEAGQS